MFFRCCLYALPDAGSDLQADLQRPIDLIRSSLRSARRTRFGGEGNRWKKRCATHKRLEVGGKAAGNHGHTGPATGSAAGHFTTGPGAEALLTRVEVLGTECPAFGLPAPRQPFQGMQPGNEGMASGVPAYGGILEDQLTGATIPEYAAAAPARSPPTWGRAWGRAGIPQLRTTGASVEARQLPAGWPRASFIPVHPRTAPAMSAPDPDGTDPGRPGLCPEEVDLRSARCRRPATTWWPCVSPANRRRPTRFQE